MRYLVTLYLLPPNDCLQQVKQLPVLEGVEIDENYGLVPVSAKRHLYVIRITGTLNAEELMARQLEIKGVYPDLNVAPMGSREEERK